MDAVCSLDWSFAVFPLGCDMLPVQDGGPMAFCGVPLDPAANAWRVYALRSGMLRSAVGHPSRVGCPQALHMQCHSSNVKLAVLLACIAVGL